MKFIGSFVVCLAFVHLSHQLTVEQMRNTGKAMRKVCQPKNHVTTDLIENISNGEFKEDKNVKCYIACIMKMAQTIRNGKLNYTSAVKQIDILFPEEMRAAAKKALDDCKAVPDKYTDICEAAFQTAKCMYNSNPENFVFP